MPSTQVNPLHNLASLLVGTGEFLFSEGATSVATSLLIGFRDFGNIVAFTPQVEIKTEEHYGSYRGVRKKDKTISTENKLAYQLKCDEWNYENLKIVFGATAGTAFTQSVQSGVSGDALAFATTAATLGRWYDLKVSGARIRKITTLTISTKTEGTDFVVDLLLGRVKFLTAQSSNLTPVITAPAITSSDYDYFTALTPFGDVIKQGYGRLICYDQDDNNIVALDHTDFSCEVTLDSIAEVNGTGIGELTMNVSVTDAVGTVYVRRSNNYIAGT